MPNNPFFFQFKEKDFELFNSIIFFLLAIFFTNTYVINDFVHFPVTVALLIGSFVMGYYYITDSNSNKPRTF